MDQESPHHGGKRHCDLVNNWGRIEKYTPAELLIYAPNKHLPPIRTQPTTATTMAHAESNAGGEERWIEAEAMSDNEDELGGLFADPDPLDTFRFDFGGHHLVLSGYKAELGQTLNSTGLTLWRASEILCQYMVEHPILIENETVLEVSPILACNSDCAYTDANRPV